MWEVAGPDAGVEWAGTFLWVLLPGAVIGALLGLAEYRRWTGTVPHRRWLVWSPMLFAAVLLQNPLDLVDGFEGGVGLAAAAVPASCMLGGYAIAGSGPGWVRGLCALVALSAVPIWSLTATDVGGSSMSLGSPRGRWPAFGAGRPERGGTIPPRHPSSWPEPADVPAPTTASTGDLRERVPTRHPGQTPDLRPPP